MFGSGLVIGRAAAPSLWSARRRSARDGLGVRYPMELTQRIRLSRARRRIKWVFERGSPVQSWLKQMMSRPRSAPPVGGVISPDAGGWHGNAYRPAGPGEAGS